MKERDIMVKEPPSWSPDVGSGTVLMEYLQRASPQFVAAELDQLGLLDAADQAAAAVLMKLEAERPRRKEAALPRKLAAMLALAMCAMIVVVAETRHLGVMNVLPENDGSHFMQLAGPTPEW
jgi:hypothetical protein